MSSDETCFRELDHTADLAVEVWGADFASLLARAAEAVFALQGLPAKSDAPARHEIQLTAPDREALLVDWLNELLYLSESQGECYTSFEVTLASNTELRAVVSGQAGRPTKRRIKAATFHELRITDCPGRCAARIVFDV
jgi:SHS2 domain-containing protein